MYLKTVATWRFTPMATRHRKHRLHTQIQFPQIERATAEGYTVLKLQLLSPVGVSAGNSTISMICPEGSGHPDVSSCWAQCYL